MFLESDQRVFLARDELCLGQLRLTCSMTWTYMVAVDQGIVSGS